MGSDQERMVGSDQEPIMKTAMLYQGEPEQEYRYFAFRECGH